MNCPICNSLSKKDGRDRKGDQRFKCASCKKRFSLPKEKLLGAMILNKEKALICLNLLVEGNSVRSTERITGVHRDIVLSLLETVGKKCLWIQENLIRGVKVKLVRADEIWSFVAMKDRPKNARQIDSEKVGSAYTFTAIDSDTKLMVAWHLGRRTDPDALIFCEKIYNAIDSGARKFQMSTSHVERQNLIMSMSMRRLTPLTNGFSKKWENLNYMLAIFFTYYNFCRVHNTLRCTPAMEAGLAKSIWSLTDLLQAEAI